MRKKKPARVKPNWRVRLHAYLEQHGHALFSSLGRLLRTPWSAFMTIAVMTVTMTLAASFHVLVSNIEQATSALRYSHHLSVFLKPEIDDRRGHELTHQLTKLPTVGQADYIDKAHGLSEFKRYSGFGDALAVLTENPLPGVIHVIPEENIADSRQLEQLEQHLNRYPEVDFVQMDLRWIKRLRALVHLVERGVGMLAILLGLAVVFIVSNTIRLELNHRRDEVLIAKLVGATDAFIRRPFIYTGFWLGFLSGLGAWLWVLILLLLIQHPIEQLSKLYDSDFQLQFLSFSDSLGLIMLAALLGMLGAGLVLQRQLHAIRPN